MSLPHCRQLLLTHVLPHRLDHEIHFAVHDRFELVHGEPDAVIGDAVFLEVIGADLGAAFAGTDLRFAKVGPALMQPLLLPFEDAGAKDAHRAVAVLVLAAFVLALDLALGGRALSVPDAYGRFRPDFFPPSRLRAP